MRDALRDRSHKQFFVLASRMKVWIFSKDRLNLEDWNCGRILENTFDFKSNDAIEKLLDVRNTFQHLQRFNNFVYNQ